MTGAVATHMKGTYSCCYDMISHYVGRMGIQVGISCGLSLVISPVKALSALSWVSIPWLLSENEKVDKFVDAGSA